MKMNNKKRLEKELLILKNKPIQGISAFPINNNLTEWKCIIKGPEKTPYENGTFYLNLKIPSDYPFKAPSLTFITKIYHPNVSVDGRICLDILNNSWSAGIFIQKLLLMVISFLNEPNPEHGLNPEALNLYKINREVYNKKAKEWTKKYAIEKK